MKIEMTCTSSQPTAAAYGATPGGARVTLQQRDGRPGKAARLELFLDAEHAHDVQLGQTKTVTID